MKLSKAQLAITLSMIFVGLGAIAALDEHSPWRSVCFVLTLVGLVAQGFWIYRGWSKGRMEEDLVDAWKKGGLVGGLSFLASLLRWDQFVDREPRTMFVFVSVVILVTLLGFFGGCVWALSQKERSGLS